MRKLAAAALIAAPYMLLENNLTLKMAQLPQQHLLAECNQWSDFSTISCPFPCSAQPTLLQLN